ncbi:MAG TPA: TonB family protein [Polyangiaceae bacterium]|nr:TonB family protein [Polyangiaceae bacterium]
MESFSPLPRWRWVGPSSFVVSIAAHLGILAAGALALSVGFTRSPVETAPATDPEIVVEIAPLHLPPLHLGPPLGEASSDEPLPVDAVQQGGGEGFARPDMDHAGRGGSRRVDSAALNLADSDDGLTLSREVTSRIDRDQIQRLQTSRERTSYEDRRSTTHPMDLVFLATGDGHRAERRPRAPSDPDRGALRADAASVRGSVVGAPSEEGDLETHAAGGALPGRDHAAPGVGVLNGAPGQDHRTSAAVARGRPRVTEGAPSIPSDRTGPPKDTVDSEQEVAATVQSLVHASTAGGVLGGGPGGQEAPGAAGSQGLAGPGSRATPFGGGSGPFTGISDADPRISAYRRSVLAKIYPLWENAFPKSASLEGKQGLAIIALVIYSDGHVDGVRVARPSGVPEFDDNVRLAVLRAAPFGRFPPNIGTSSMNWKITFDMNNPAVR